MDSGNDLRAAILRYLPYGEIRGGTCFNFYGAQRNDLDCPCQLCRSRHFRVSRYVSCKRRSITLQSDLDQHCRLVEYHCSNRRFEKVGVVNSTGRVNQKDDHVFLLANNHMPDMGRRLFHLSGVFGLMLRMGLA
jgi:hypothetical protein